MLFGERDYIVNTQLDSCFKNADSAVDKMGKGGLLGNKKTSFNKF